MECFRVAQRVCVQCVHNKLHSRGKHGKRSPAGSVAMLAAPVVVLGAVKAAPVVLCAVKAAWNYHYIREVLILAKIRWPGYVP